MFLYTSRPAVLKMFSDRGLLKPKMVHHCLLTFSSHFVLDFKSSQISCVLQNLACYVDLAWYQLENHCCRQCNRCPPPPPQSGEITCSPLCISTWWTRPCFLTTFIVSFFDKCKPEWRYEIFPFSDFVVLNFFGHREFECRYCEDCCLVSRSLWCNQASTVSCQSLQKVITRTLKMLQNQLGCVPSNSFLFGVQIFRYSRDRHFLPGYL